MRSRPLSSLSPLAILGLLIALCSTIACQPGTPEEQVAAKRALYKVSLNSWIQRMPEPEPMPLEGEEGEMADGEMADGEMADGEMADDADADADAAADADAMDGAQMVVDDIMIEPMGPQDATIMFDILVLYDGRDSGLPGLTLDVSQADAESKEKATWKHYVEMPTLLKGQSKQVGFTLEGVPFEEGDQFSVDLRHPVPAGERGEYREFTVAE